MDSLIRVTGKLCRWAMHPASVFDIERRVRVGLLLRAPSRARVRSLGALPLAIAICCDDLGRPRVKYLGNPSWIQIARQNDNGVNGLGTCKISHEPQPLGTLRPVRNQRDASRRVVEGCHHFSQKPQAIEAQDLRALIARIDLSPHHGIIFATAAR